MVVPPSSLARIAVVAVGSAVVLLALTVSGVAGGPQVVAACWRCAWVLLGFGALLMWWSARRAAPEPAPPLRHEPWLASATSPHALSLVDAAMQAVKASSLPATAAPVPAVPLARREPGLLWLPFALTSLAAAFFVSSTPNPRAVPATAAQHASVRVAMAHPEPSPMLDLPALAMPTSPDPQRLALQAARAAIRPAALPARPLAGRQVLRCSAQGRVTYTDAGGHCTEGDGERITVFPTQGVNSRPVPFR
jgi:hypothetical protein